MQASIKSLQESLEKFEIVLNVEILQREINFLEEMQRWNNRINLTAIIDPLEILEKHLLDSLILLKWCRQGQLLDVGSGAGLPGIPLAIACPELEVFSIEAVGKKCAFQKHLKRSLKLDNLQILNERIESHHSADGYAQIVARAFAPPDKMINYIRHLVRVGTRVFFMLGAAQINTDQLERFSEQEKFAFINSYEYILPLSGAKRKLFLLEKQS